MMGLFNLFKKEKKDIISTVPDTPISFGMKNSWLVLKADDPSEVMDKLGCSDRKVCNWQSAFNWMDDNWMIKPQQVFVTPSYEGYVLVLNCDELLENKAKLDQIATMFEEVQYYATHRVVELCCFAKYLNGQLIRSYYYVGDSGEVYWNEGAITNEEKELGLTNLPYEGLEDYDNVTYPSEYEVDELAAKWGVDPFLDKYQDTKSTGYLCVL